MEELDNIKKQQNDFKSKFPSKSSTFETSDEASAYLLQITSLDLFLEGVVINDENEYHVRYRLKTITDGDS